jgi:hypothetical protein
VGPFLDKVTGCLQPEHSYGGHAKPIKGVRCQVSGVRADRVIRFWGFRRDDMGNRGFLDVNTHRAGRERRSEVPVSCPEVPGFGSCVSLA